MKSFTQAKAPPPVTTVAATSRRGAVWSAVRTSAAALAMVLCLLDWLSRRWRCLGGRKQRAAGHCDAAARCEDVHTALVLVLGAVTAGAAPREPRCPVTAMLTGLQW